MQNRKHIPLCTGFEPGSRYPRSLATHPHVNYSYSLLPHVSFLFYYLILIHCNELTLGNEIGNSCETKENKYNSHVDKWLKSVDNTNLVRIQCEAVYFFLFCTLSFH